MYLYLVKRYKLPCLRTMCACRDWCSLVHKTTYKQQDERRRTHSAAYEARCILIGLCTMQERMYRCTESIYYRVTQLGLARVIGCSIMRIIFRSGSSRRTGGKFIYVCQNAIKMVMRSCCACNLYQTLSLRIARAKTRSEIFFFASLMNPSISLNMLLRQANIWIILSRFKK